MDTLQTIGLKQNQPSIKPLNLYNGFTTGGLGPPGAGGGNPTSEFIKANMNDPTFRSMNQHLFSSSSGPQEIPGQPVTPTSSPQTPAPPPTAVNTPAPGMDYLEGVRSREQRSMDRNLAEAIASSKKRGLNTSALGQNLENTARADLNQRMQENVSAAAYQQYQLQQQMQHERSMQELIGSQRLNERKLDTDENLRGAQGMIPIATTEYQAGIDAYRNNFPNLFNQQANPQTPLTGQPNQGDDAANAALIKIMGGSGGRTREDLLGSGGSSTVPQIGPGSSPSNALGGAGNEDPGFDQLGGTGRTNGQLGLFNRPGQTPTSQTGQTTRPGQTSGFQMGNTDPFVNRANPTTPAPVNTPPGWSPQTSGPNQNMSPIVPQFTGGPRQGTSPLQASTNSLGLPGLK